MAAADDHARCTFPEITIAAGDFDTDDPLQPGMRVLGPCSCGETPMDHLGMVEGRVEELQAVLLDLEPRRALFHWAPTARRKQIVRFGLRPHMRATTSSGLDGTASDARPWRAPVICLADSPSWAWALSGEQSHAPVGEWDLWQTALDQITEPHVLPSTDRASGIHEVRTEHRIYKRHLWLVATRSKGRVLAGEA